MKITLFNLLKRSLILIGLVLNLVLLGCTPPALNQRPIPTFEGLPILPETATPTTLPAETPAAIISEPAPPLPATPTPVLYTVVANDTFSAIANRHDITLATLLAANPQVDPNFLTIGMTIILPIDPNPAQPTNLPTPIPVNLTEPTCYPTADQGLWCLISAENNQIFNIENLSALITLTTPQGDILAAQTANSALNLISADQIMVLSTFFPPPIPPEIQVHTELLTGLPVAAGDERYSQPEIKVNQLSINPNGDSAHFQVEILMKDNGSAESKSTLVAVAFDDNDLPCGFRKFNLAPPVTPNEIVAIETEIFSLGPPIKQVAFYAETRP